MEPRAWSLLRIRALHVALARIAHAFGGAPTEWLRGYAEGALHAIDAASAIEDRAALARWIDAHEAAHARVSGAALPALVGTDHAAQERLLYVVLAWVRVAPLERPATEVRRFVRDALALLAAHEAPEADDAARTQVHALIAESERVLEAYHVMRALAAVPPVPLPTPRPADGSRP